MTVLCGLCPHNCQLKEEQTGLCRVRTNVGGKVVDSYFGKLSALGMDPIEKKPLYHFYPGRQILSAGFYGCSFRCPFCQNYSISQNVGMYNHQTSPQELVDLALSKKSFGIAYTYSEPLVHFEYLMETAALARKAGLKNVLVSNGFINPGPASELLPLLDAANIDLKSFNADFYRKELKGELTAVMNFIETAHQKIHLEVTTLVIPGKTDDPGEMSALTAFLASLNPDIPFHLSAYYPQYNYTVQATSPEKILKMVEIAKKRLRYVYPGNISRGDSDTHCRSCGTVLINRRGFEADIRLSPAGTCPECGAPGPVVMN